MTRKEEILELIEKITKEKNINMLYGVVKTMVEYEDHVDCQVKLTHFYV